MRLLHLFGRREHPKELQTTWLLALEKLKIGSNILLLGIISLDQALCPSCRISTENVSQLFFVCFVTLKIWTHMFYWWEKRGIVHGKAIVNIEMWSHMVWSGIKTDLWVTLFFNVVLSVWYYKNELKFGNKNEDVTRLIDKIPFSLWMVANILDAFNTWKMFKLKNKITLQHY